MAWLSKSRRKNPATGRTSTYYHLAWRAHGQVVTKSLGFVPLTEAKRAKIVVEGRLAEGTNPLPEPPRGHGASSRMPTVAEYLRDTWIPVVRRDHSDSTLRVEKNAANNLSRLMGQVPLDQVDFRVADRFVTQRRREGRKTRTVQLDLRTLKRALRHAERCRVIPFLPELPVVKITDAKPHRWLSPEESERLLAAARPPDEQPGVTRGTPPKRYDWLSYLAISMALNLGMRKSEILSRGWEDLRWDRGPHGVLVIAAKPAANFQVKTRRSRVIPLTPELETLLRQEHARRGRPATGWIFPNPRDPMRPRKEFKKALRLASERAGLEPVHPHALRHTWASRLAMAGVDRRTLMELGGWRDGRMLDEVYAHVSDDHMAQVMARVGIGPRADA